MKKIRVMEMIDRPFLGGGQMTVLTLARNLDKDKFDVLVASEGEGLLVDELKKAGVRHIPVKIGKKTGFLGIKGLSDALRTNAVDILHTHGGIAGLYGRMAARRAGIPSIIHTIHGIHYLHYRNPLAKYASLILERRLSKFTDAVIFVSESDLGKGLHLRLALPERARLIRNGVVLTALTPTFDPAAKRTELGADGGPLIVAVSRLHRQKGLVFLLRALPAVIRRRPDAKAAIVGGGPLEARLEAESRDLGLGDRVVFLGERTDVAEILAAADLFVLPSLWEGLPYAVVEAAAAGRPIIASDIDGVREVIRNGKTGVLVPPGDSAKLAEAMIGLIESPARATTLAREARREIPPLYSIERMIQETEALYLELFRRQSDQIK
jgi:glycosyltransferase involved in cell wall biosynthesis